MGSHSIFGLTISADFPITALPESSSSVDVEILAQLLPAKPSWDDDEWDVSGPVQDRTFFWIEAGAFNIRNGRKIRYDAAGHDEDCVRDSLLGECVAVAMIQRGDFVLHGSVVSRDGKAVVFVGESGLGKSSLAACLVQDCWTALADDLAAVRHKDNRQLIFPGYPQFNLCPDALSALGIESGNLPFAYEGSLKKAWPTNLGNDADAAAIFILQEGEQYEVTPLKGTTAVVALLENTFAAHLTRSYETSFLDQQAERQYLSAAASLVGSCSIYRFTVPKSDFTPDAAMAALADYLP